MAAARTRRRFNTKQIVAEIGQDHKERYPLPAERDPERLPDEVQLHCHQMLGDRLLRRHVSNAAQRQNRVHATGFVLF
jgi:hypothetical protein